MLRLPWKVVTLIVTLYVTANPFDDRHCHRVAQSFVPGTIRTLVLGPVAPFYSGVVVRKSLQAFTLQRCQPTHPVTQFNHVEVV